MTLPDLDTITYLYFGNLLPHEPQYTSGLFHGLALVPHFDRDIQHDATTPLPFPDNAIRGFQSQDVFEHIAYDKLPAILDEIYRCLRPDGMFRLSLPDYNSPLLKDRSVYNSQGRILCDLAMGGHVACALQEPIRVTFDSGGDTHVWFPTYCKVLHLVMLSELRKCNAIAVHHAWLDPYDDICRPFDASVMPVSRAPPYDMRSGGKPISIIIDFMK